MDSKGRAHDNIFVERLWRSVKYENIYLNDYQTMTQAREGLEKYFEFYNRQRFHQSLGYKTPSQLYFADYKNFQKIAGSFADNFFTLTGALNWS